MIAVPQYLSIVDGGPDAPERIPVLRRRAEIERALELVEQALALCQEAASLTHFGYESDGCFPRDWVRELRPMLDQPGEFIVTHWFGPDFWTDAEEPERIRRENEALLDGADFTPTPEAERIPVWG